MTKNEATPLEPISTGTVLVVDDIVANRDLLRATLEPQGYEVLLAANGEQALKVAQRAAPDVILLDVNMPGIDGFETCRRLRKTEGARDVPVIFITANDGTDSVVEGFRAGGVDFVTKPFKAEEVLMRVETHLKINRLARELKERNGELTALNRSLQAEIIRRQQAEQSLSLMDEKRNERFHAGGTLRHDAPSYVERQADRDLLDALGRGEYCHVLTSRQMGKSSLMARTAHKLRQQGFDVATLDLAAVGQNLTIDQWYDGLLTRVGWQLRLEDQLEEFWMEHGRLGAVQRFFTALRQVLLARNARRLVIFVDELDVVRSLPFGPDEFFAGLRETFNGRSEDASLNRIAFCLLGVVAPSELTGQAERTPFNIGTRIELHDFSWPEALPWARALGGGIAEGQDLLERIHHWTGGHPYLTQKLCQGVVARGSVRTPGDVDELVHELLLSVQARERDDNLIFVRERLVRSQASLPEVLPLYRIIRSGGTVPAGESSREITALALSGIVRSDNGRLVVRNRVYERVFDGPWAERAMSSRSNVTTD